jgi:hypothetical protein
MPAHALIVAMLMAAFSSAPASAKRPRISSAYTTITSDAWRNCPTVDEEEEWEVKRCPGYHGIPVFFQLGDRVNADVDFGSQDNDDMAEPESWYGEFEWRLRDGKPFAVIYRVLFDDPGLPKTSKFAVETIGDASRPGCRIADIDAANRRAHMLARRAADAVLAGKASCLDEKDNKPISAKLSE